MQNGTIALGLVLILVAACAPRFEGTGEFLAGRDATSTAATPEPAGTETAQDLGAGGSELSDQGRGGATAATSSGRTVQGPRSDAGQTVIGRGGRIKVGGLFPLSGGLSTLGQPAFQAANAYFRYLNARGGIDGATIEFITCDDQADDTRSTTCAKKLIEQDGIFVMGPSFTPFSFTVIGHLEDAGVPWIGYDGINVEGFRASNVVTVGAPIETMAHALLPRWYRKTERALGSAPDEIGAVVLQVAPAKTYAREAQDVICPRLGCTITRAQDVNYADTEYATICRNMQNARVDSVWIVTDPASAVKLYVQCREINYRPPAGWLGQHGIYMDLTLQQSGAFADGTIANGAVLPDAVDAAPNREMKEIVRAYYPDASFGYFASLGYASARLVEDVIRQAFASGDELTRAGVLSATARMGAYDCHGLCKDVDLRPPAAQHGGNHNIWLVRAEGGRWVMDDGPIDAWTSETWPCPGRPYGGC